MTRLNTERASEIIGKDEIDLASDPPPDVIVEIDIHHSSIRKLAFYAQLGVPEVWRYDGNRAVFYRLAESGYEETSTSLAFPSFAADLDGAPGRDAHAWPARGAESLPPLTSRLTRTH